MSLVSKLDPRHWRYLRRTFNKLRQEHFSTDGAPRQFHLDATVEELRIALGRHHFTNAWELSYHYEGEILNMRQPVYVDDEYGWYQLHVRAFDSDGAGIDVHVHLELEPTEYPYEHIEEINFSPDDGAERFTTILDEIGIAYERIE